jgi:hypothetical protein
LERTEVPAPISPLAILIEHDAKVSEALIAELGTPRAERWTLPRNGYRPQVTIARSGDTLVAAMLTTARPATAATKIADLWWNEGSNDSATSGAAAAALLDNAIEKARARGDVALKWEIAPDGALAPVGAERGFVEMRRPWAAVGTENVRGFVLWLTPTEHAEPGYYSQTTLYTCGAIAALIAADGVGIDGLTGTAADRDLEIDFWRKASNFPACEPIGLAVALQDRLQAPGVEVALDHEGPVLLEDFTGFDYDFRAELQEESRHRAGTAGIPIRADRVSVDEIARRVAADEFALLLIDEAPMHGEVGPHWIVAHATVGDTVLVQDPWINVATGETWVDTHQLPVSFADLDRLIRWSSDEYRGVIFSPRTPRLSRG